MLIFAHRGASGQYPENTYAAFDAAIAQQADFIELDITLSADGQWLVLHDDTLDRTTNGKGVAGFTNAKALAALDAGSWKNKDFASESIPMIADVLARYKDRVQFNIEIKPFFPITRGDLFEQAIESLIDTVRKQGLVEKTLISSVNFYILDLLRNYDSELKLALVYQRSITDYDPRYVHQRLNLWSIHPYYRQLNSDFVKACKDSGMRLIPYTINRAEQYQRVADLPLDGLITNWPARARQWL